MESDTNSNTTVYNTIPQFNNSDIKTPDEYDNSEPSPSSFSQPPFQPIHSQVKTEPISPPSPISYVTPTYSLLTSEPSDNNRQDNTQISHELDNFITLQQQVQHPQTLTIHQHSRSITSSNPSTRTPSSNYTPSQNPISSSTHYLVSTALIEPLKENSQIPHSHLTQEHPPHLSIIHFILIPKNSSKSVYLFSFIIRTSIQTPMMKNPIMLTNMFYTLHLHGNLITTDFTNPQSLPLYNKSNDNEVCSTQLYLLTTALTPKQFTQIGYRQSLTKFTAPKAIDYSIYYYDQNIIRPNEDLFLNNDPFANPQLTEEFFIKIPYTFTFNFLIKKRQRYLSSTTKYSCL